MVRRIPPIGRPIALALLPMRNAAHALSLCMREPEVT